MQLDYFPNSFSPNVNTLEVTWKEQSMFAVHHTLSLDHLSCLIDSCPTE